eukprot:5614432-Prymnesium_polylepis.1
MGYKVTEKDVENMLHVMAPTDQPAPISRPAAAAAMAARGSLEDESIPHISFDRCAARGGARREGTRGGRAEGPKPAR